jgi:tripartite ATP-independent transporter DctM subunit
MDANMVGLMGIAALLIIIFLRMPVSFAMFIVGFVGMFLFAGPLAAFNILSSDIWGQFSSYTLSVIPLYVLMGEIIFRSGITQNLFDAAYKWLGHFKGGMASTTILASAGFASICGSNTATAATMGTMALPALKKYNYDSALSTGSIATGGTLGILIPPSTVLIIIAIQTQQSVQDLFIAVIFPGVLLTALLIMTIIFLCQKNPEMGPAGPKFSFKEKLKALSGVIPVFLLFMFVIGGLYLGWFTPTESGAFGAFGAIMLTMISRKFTWANFIAAIESTIRSTAMVLMLIVGAVIFGRFLTATRLPFGVAEFVGSLSVPPVVVLLAIILIYVIGGALMDALGFLILSIPIFYPTVMMLGYDPVWFGILLCVVTSLGAITPPVGVNVFVVQGISKDVPITTVFKGTSYFLVTYTVFIALLIIFPGIVLFVL